MTESPVTRHALTARTVSLCAPLAHLALLTFLALAAAGVFAAPADARLSTTRDDLVRLDMGSVSTPVDGSLAATVTVTIDLPTSYLESRLQIRHPGGRLIYQKTEVRSDIETGTVDIAYMRGLADLNLEPGSYPIELRVRSDSETVREWVIENRLLVYDPNAPRVPVVLMSRINGAPTFDAAGRFVIDPASVSRARRDAEHLARLVLADPGVRISLAIPPVLLEDWLRASRGYEVLRDDSVAQVAADDPAARSCAGTLDLLKRAERTGRLEFLDVPYAAPDIGALQATGRLHDLSDHYRRSVSGYLAALETTPVPGTAVPGDALPVAALDLLDARGLEFAVLGPASAASHEATLAAGVYRSGHLAILMTDPNASEALAAGDVDAVLDAVFARVVSAETTVPYTLSVDLGPGRAAHTEAIREVVAGLRGVPWVAFTTAARAAAHAPAPSITLITGVAPAPGARPGYWKAVSETRRYSSALLTAAGLNDPQAHLVNDASMIAQSRLWAGSDDRWAAADRGRAFAEAAMLAASAVLDAVSISAPPDLTLSSATGDVPVSVTNASGKELDLTIRTRAEGIRVTRPEQVLRFRPQENFVTVPVNLQSSLSGRLYVEVWADDIMLAESVTAVRASYLDRLAIVGGVALVLMAMLLFIHRRVRAGGRAGTITGQNDRRDRR